MTRLMTYFVWLLLVLVPAMPLFGAEHEEASMKDEKSDAAKDAARERAVAVAEKSVVTSHSVAVGGRTMIFSGMTSPDGPSAIAGFQILRSRDRRNTCVL